VDLLCKLAGGCHDDGDGSLPLLRQKAGHAQG
jgi:hypothetical protein